MESINWRGSQDSGKRGPEQGQGGGWWKACNKQGPGQGWRDQTLRQELGPPGRSSSGGSRDVTPPTWPSCLPSQTECEFGFSSLILAGLPGAPPLLVSMLTLFLQLKAESSGIHEPSRAAAQGQRPL